MSEYVNGYSGRTSSLPFCSPSFLAHLPAVSLSCLLTTQDWPLGPLQAALGFPSLAPQHTIAAPVDIVYSSLPPRLDHRLDCSVTRLHRRLDYPRHLHISLSISAVREDAAATQVPVLLLILRYLAYYHPHPSFCIIPSPLLWCPLFQPLPQDVKAVQRYTQPHPPHSTPALVLQPFATHLIRSRIIPRCFPLPSLAAGRYRRLAVLLARGDSLEYGNPAMVLALAPKAFRGLIQLTTLAIWSSPTTARLVIDVTGVMVRRIHRASQQWLWL
ncbi:hypothetical protein B0H13DRAFT_2667946 [Mycena leptocephala]|nr:hypothetical protein B0H13DRAFT_2667946 [Mycena leptocephala]